MNNDRALAALRRWARLFDSAFRIPGTRVSFGLDPLIGLIPGLGDLMSPALTLLILWHAAAMRVPKIVLVRMVVNAVLDAGIGAVPLVGDLFDFAWKANEANLKLLERHAIAGARATSGDWLFVGLCLLVVVAAAFVPLIVILWIGRRLV
jgi:Domain of unknown function (DUF4112)